MNTIKKRFIAFMVELTQELGVGLLLLGLGFLAFNNGVNPMHTVYAVAFLVLAIVLIAVALIVRLRSEE